MAHNTYTFRYRVRNWPHYNQALIARGEVTFWVAEGALNTWRNTDTRRGSDAPRVYSDKAIHCAVVVKSVYRGQRAGRKPRFPLGETRSE